MARFLSRVELPNSTNSCCGSEGTPEQVLGNAAVSRGRIFFVSSDAIYAIGSKQATSPTGFATEEVAVAGSGNPAYLQVSPTELSLEPGQTVKLRARSFDASGRFLREEKATWSLKVSRARYRRCGHDQQTDSAGGLIKATVGGLTGEARARVAHPLPWTENFDSYADGAIPPGWANTVPGRLVVATLDGQKVLQKEPLNTIFQRGRTFIGHQTGPTTPSRPTCAPAAPTSDGRRRRHGAALFARPVRNHAAVEARAMGAGDGSNGNGPFAWKPDVVSDEAPSRKPAQRSGSCARQGMGCD